MQVANAFTFLFMVCAIFSIIACTLFGSADPDHFRNFSASFFTARFRLSSEHLHFHFSSMCIFTSPTALNSEGDWLSDSTDCAFCHIALFPAAMADVSGDSSLAAT